MARETKVVKGGVRATLALIISIVALIFSVGAYTSTPQEQNLNKRIQDLQARLENMKQESSEQIGKLREETAETLEKLSNAVKMDEETTDQ